MNKLSTSRSSAGFTLIELMVALVIGLVVVLAATGFVASVAKANSENIQVTRLTQELRAMSEIVARDLRRARYLPDPVSTIATGGLVNHDAIVIGPASNCIVFAYGEPPDPPAVAATVSRSIWLDSAAGDIYLNTAGTACSGGVAVNSPQIEVTALRFSQATTNPSRYDITLTGRLATPAPGSPLDGLTRTFRQSVYVRSGPVN